MYPPSTFAYDWYVNDDFIKPFKKYINRKLYQNYDSEILLHHAMCKRFSESIRPMFNFDTILHNYIKKLYTSSPKPLSEEQMNKILTKERAKLEAYGKLKICLNLIDKGDYELDVLDYLMAILTKLKKMQITTIKGTKEYSYLNKASREMIHVNFDISDILKMDLKDQVDGLFKRIISNDFHNDTHKLETYLGVDLNSHKNETFIFGVVLEEYDESLQYYDTNLEEIFDIAEDKFQEQLNKKLHNVNISQILSK